MALDLFTLKATLELDTTDFTTGADAAVDKADEIKSAVDAIDTSGIDAEIAALDTDIGNLDSEIAALDDEIDSLSTDIDGLDEKASFASNAIQTAVEIGKELAVAALEALFEFAGESLDYIETSGTTVGNAYKNAKQEFSLATDVMKQRTGTVLAPMVMAFYDLAESLAGVTAQDKINVMLGQLDSYRFEHLQGVKDSLEGIFGVFEKYEVTQLEELMSPEQMIDAMKSQENYWLAYEKTIRDLKDRGLSDDFLGMYADGSQESFDYLYALRLASDEQIKAVNEQYDAMKEARDTAAGTIADAQLSVDESVDNMLDSIARMATEIDTEAPFNEAMTAAQGIIDGLAAKYPGISVQVDMINAKLAQMGRNWERMAVFTGESPLIQGKAVGMDYVPYDDYPAYLHEGEAVLTKAEATEWRRGYGGTAEIDYDRLAVALASAVRGMSVDMDGVSVGRIVTPTVSREIARESQKRRYG